MWLKEREICFVASDVEMLSAVVQLLDKYVWSTSVDPLYVKVPVTLEIKLRIVLGESMSFTFCS